MLSSSICGAVTCQRQSVFQMKRYQWKSGYCHPKIQTETLRRLSNALGADEVGDTAVIQRDLPASPPMRRLHDNYVLDKSAAFITFTPEQSGVKEWSYSVQSDGSLRDAAGAIWT